MRAEILCYVYFIFGEGNQSPNIKLNFDHFHFCLIIKGVQGYTNPYMYFVGTTSLEDSCRLKHVIYFWHILTIIQLYNYGEP